MSTAKLELPHTIGMTVNTPDLSKLFKALWDG